MVKWFKVVEDSLQNNHSKNKSKAAGLKIEIAGIAMRLTGTFFALAGGCRSVMRRQAAGRLKKYVDLEFYKQDLPNNCYCLTCLYFVTLKLI